MTFPISNRVVVHYKNGKVIKGTTFNFSPQKDFFHLIPPEPKGERQLVKVNISQLKAIFFVKSLKGKIDYSEKKEFSTRIFCLSSQPPKQ